EKIILSWQDLNLNHGQLYLGWKAISQKESFDAVNGGKIFDITTNVGYCSYRLYLGKERETFEPLKGILCFKKLYMSQGG
ncbi:hypothetical protein J5S76_04030, partial [Bacillus amyloliquefaciens]|nr:hypothetical protein [Bacillus amyloliquefaciens]